MRTATTEVEPQRKGVDGGALIRATVVAALVSFALYLFLVPVLVGAGNAAVILQYMASVVLGANVLPPPTDVSLVTGLVAIAVHIGISIVMAAVIAFILHRWGLVTGIVGGAALGVVFFAIIHYSLTLAYPHFYAMNHWSVALVHAVFGAVAGGVYELYECEPGEQLGRGNS